MAAHQGRQSERPHKRPAEQAEGRGFEPLRPEGLPVFKTGALSRTLPPLRSDRHPGRPGPSIADLRMALAAWSGGILDRPRSCREAVARTTRRRGGVPPRPSTAWQPPMPVTAVVAIALYPAASATAWRGVFHEDVLRATHDGRLAASAQPTGITVDGRRPAGPSRGLVSPRCLSSHQVREVSPFSNQTLMGRRDSYMCEECRAVGRGFS